MITPKMFYNRLTPYAPLAVAPFVGPQNRPYARSYNNQRTITKKRKYAKTVSFRSKIFNTLPAKHFTSESATTVLHNNIYSVVPTTGITQGTSNTNRLGDAIHLCAIKIRGTVQAATASNGYSYRILVGFNGEEYSIPSTPSTSGISSSELFLPSTGTTYWAPNGIVNPKAFTVLYDETIDVNSQITSASDLQSYAATISINQDFDYQQATSGFGKTKNLFVILIGSVIGGTSGVTAAGAMTLSSDLIFK